jgi:hypothetical protein
MQWERRRGSRSGDPRDIEELLAEACGTSFSLQAREDRLRGALLASARSASQARSQERLVEISQALAVVVTESAEVRARIVRLREELSRALSAVG